MSKLSGGGGGNGDMRKSVYDPDADGVIDVGQTEADMKKVVYDPDTDGQVADAQLTNQPQTVDIRAQKPTDDLLHSHDAEVSLNSETYTKMKEVEVWAYGVLRFCLDIHRTPTAEARAQIYINDVAAGVVHATSNSNYVTFTDDLQINGGDKVSVWIKTSTAANAAYLRNFRIKGATPTVKFHTL